MCASTHFTLAGVLVQHYMGVFILLEVPWVPGESRMDGCAVLGCCTLPSILNLLFACALVQDPGLHLIQSAARQPLTVG